VRALVPGLEGKIHPTYPPYNLRVPDNQRVDVWLEEFRELEKNGQLPRLSIIRLGNDHTAGTRPGYPTPRAMIAENDLALGRVVEAISKSRYWKESAVFVLEDDAQNGPDHVDAHRSVLLVASPYARRGAVDSTFYTTSSVVRTIGLILGLDPLSQYDAGATPLLNAFTSLADTAHFATRPSRWPLDELNPRAFRSGIPAHDLAHADAADEAELNREIWESVRTAPLPAPRRAGVLQLLRLSR